MAKLKRVLEAAEHSALSPALKELYTERGGKFLLDADDAEGLQTSLEAERAAKKALEAKLAGYGDLTPEQVKELQSNTAKAQREVDLKAGNFEKILAEREAKHTKDLELAAKAQERLKATLESALIGEEAMRAIVANKGNPALLLPIIKARTKLETVGDREVAVVIGEKGGPLLKAGAQKADEYMPIAEFVAGMKADKTYAGAFESAAGSGSGGQRAVAHSQRPSRQAPDLVAQGQRVIEALQAGATTISE